MPLVDLKTDLTSLKFGNDRPGAGSSRQPFIVGKPLNQRISEDGVESLGRTGGPDFLLRGGLLAPVRAATDASRLYQLFTQTSTGVIFTAKQNLLSRIGTDIDGGYPFLTPGKPLNGPLNEGIYTPLSTLGQALVNPVGIHLFKQGLNPITGGPKYTTLMNPLGANINVAGIGNKNFNRLVNLYDNKITSKVNNLIGGNVLFRYSGGPGSILGIGNTTINRASDKTPFKGLGRNGSINYSTFGQADIKKASAMGSGDGIDAKGPFSFLGFGKTSAFPEDFRAELIDSKRKAFRERSNISKAPDYTEYNIEKRVNFNNPGQRGVDRSSYSKGRPDIPLGVDKINSLYLYRSQNVTTDERKNDLVKFRIATIDNNDPLYKVFTHFRAYVNSFTDSMSSSWNKFKYLGRGEDFFNYQGFTNSITMGFTVAAQSKTEMPIIYQKLNYLKSTLSPDYSIDGFMRGNIHQLTLGGYLFEVPGIIESLTYTIPNDSPWEISINDEGGYDRSVKELPHRVDVQMTFTPIYSFLPRKVINVDGKENIIQRFISLEDAIGMGTNNLYAGEKNADGTYVGVPDRFQPDDHVPNPVLGTVIAETPIPTGVSSADNDELQSGGTFAGTQIQGG